MPLQQSLVSSSDFLKNNFQQLKLVKVEHKQLKWFCWGNSLLSSCSIIHETLALENII